jgi:hypothetical protein
MWTGGGIETAAPFLTSELHGSGPLHPRGSLWYPLYRRPGVPQSQSAWYGEEKIESNPDPSAIQPVA